MFLCRLNELQRDQLVAALLESLYNFTDEIALNAVRLSWDVPLAIWWTLNTGSYLDHDVSTLIDRHGGKDTSCKDIKSDVKFFIRYLQIHTRHPETPGSTTLPLHQHQCSVLSVSLSRHTSSRPGHCPDGSRPLPIGTRMLRATENMASSMMTYVCSPHILLFQFTYLSLAFSGWRNSRSSASMHHSRCPQRLSIYRVPEIGFKSLDSQRKIRPCLSSETGFTSKRPTRSHIKGTMDPTLRGMYTQ